MSKIKIRNFGPIKKGYLENDGWMDIKKLTAFIGNQGSGKSTVAKLISTLTWIEKSLVREEFKEKDIEVYNRLKKHISYQNIGNYFTENTFIDYQGDAFSITYVDGTTHIRRNEGVNYLFPKIMYIPAERNFVSAVDKPSSLKKLPSTLYTFLDVFEDAKQDLKSGADLKGSISLPIGNVKFEYHKLNKTSYIVGNDYKIRLSEASSGFQSFVPLFLVSRFLTNSINNEQDAAIKQISIIEEKKIRKEIELILSNEKLTDDVKKAALEFLSQRFSYSCFINIVEEPEQNLFPSSQRQMLYSLLDFVKHSVGNKLILTTHSPYIINFISIAIQGDYLMKKIQSSKKYEDLILKLDRIIPVTSVIASSDVNIYQLNERDGSINKLIDFEGIPSDKNYLNISLGECNQWFDALLEIEQEL